jgi:hypothetical protein
MEFPDWIQSSPLYKELIETYGDVNEFAHTIPPMYLQFNENIADPHGFIQTVHLLKYWCVEIDQVPVYFFNVILEFIYYFVRENTELATRLKEELDSFDSNILEFLNHNDRFDRERGMLDYAIMNQHLPLIYYMKITKGTIVIFGWELYRMAIRYNALKSFIYLQTEILGRDPNLPFLENGLFESCLVHNSLDILKYIYTDACLTECDITAIAEGGCDHLSYDCLDFLLKKGLKPHLRIIYRICRIGDLKLLTMFFQYFENIMNIHSELNTNMNLLISLAAARGHIECVKFLYDFYPQIVWKSNCTAAHDTINNNCPIETLEFLLSKGFPVNEKTTALACKVGRLDALKLLRQYGCPWDKECLKDAAIFEREDCFMYAFENGCPRPKFCVFG